MEASLQQNGIRDFRKILTCMAKFGDELSMHATTSGLQLSTINSNKSAFCLSILSTAAFHKYELTGEPAASGKGIKCKLYIKSILSIFGRGNAPQNVEWLHLSIYDPEDALRGAQRRKANRSVGDGDNGFRSGTREARLTIRLDCRHGVRKTHSLNLSACSFLVAIVDTDTLISKFVVPARVLRDWIDHFNLSAGSSGTSGRGNGEAGSAITIRYDNELSWLFEDERVKVKTWEGGTTMRRSISTEITVPTKDFDEYYLGGEDAAVQMTFPMKEFRAAFSLAESLSVPLTTAFSTAGQPLSIQLGTHAIRVDIAIATTICEAFNAEVEAAKSKATQRPRSTIGQTSRDGSVLRTDVGRMPPPAAHAGHSGSGMGHGSKRASLGLSQQKDPDSPFRPLQTHTNGETGMHWTNGVAETPAQHENEPLFYPGPSQETHVDDERVLEESGWQHLTQMSQKEMDEMMGLDEDEDNGNRDELSTSRDRQSGPAAGSHRRQEGDHEEDSPDERVEASDAGEDDDLDLPPTGHVAAPMSLLDDDD